MLYKDRKRVMGLLRQIYWAETMVGAEQALTTFAAGVDGQCYPTIAPSGDGKWEYITPGFVYPPEIRCILTMTNASRASHSQLCRMIKTRSHFLTDETATKFLYLALRDIKKRSSPAPA